MKHISFVQVLFPYQNITSIKQPKHTKRDRHAKIQLDECLFT